MTDTPARLTADQCRQKAAECREQASLARNEGHRIMLLHMADTWERIASTTLADGK